MASDEPTLSKEQIKEFLLTAKVVRSQQSKKGITNPWRLTLTDGTITHAASFRSIDEHRTLAKLGSGRIEPGFVDSYKYSRLCARGVAWTGRYAASVCRAQMARGRRLAELVVAVMARRHKIVVYFQKLISEKGENEVLY